MQILSLKRDYKRSYVNIYVWLCKDMKSLGPIIYIFYLTL